MQVSVLLWVNIAKLDRFWVYSKVLWLIFLYYLYEHSTLLINIVQVEFHGCCLFHLRCHLAASVAPTQKESFTYIWRKWRTKVMWMEILVSFIELATQLLYRILCKNVNTISWIAYSTLKSFFNSMGHFVRSLFPMIF